MRSEEQKSQDIIIHEKRYRANEILEIIKVWKRKAAVICAVSAVVFFAVLISFILAAYDAQNLILTASLIAAYFLLVILSYNIGGAVTSGGFGAFRNAKKLAKKWDYALLDFEAMEDKVAERTAMPGDMEKCESKLIDVATTLASFGEKHNL